MSLIVPPPFAMPTLPAAPESTRIAIRVSTLGLNAVGIWSSVKTEKQDRYNVLRPNVSDNGARMRGPNPSITVKPVVAPMTTFIVVPRSSAMELMPGVNMELASGLRTLNHQQTEIIRISKMLTRHHGNNCDVRKLLGA